MLKLSIKRPTSIEITWPCHPIYINDYASTNRIKFSQRLKIHPPPLIRIITTATRSINRSIKMQNSMIADHHHYSRSSPSSPPGRHAFQYQWLVSFGHKETPLLLPPHPDLVAVHCSHWLQINCTCSSCGKFIGWPRTIRIILISQEIGSCFSFWSFNPGNWAIKTQNSDSLNLSQNGKLNRVVFNSVLPFRKLNRNDELEPQLKGNPDDHGRDLKTLIDTTKTGSE